MLFAKNYNPYSTGLNLMKSNTYIIIIGVMLLSFPLLTARGNAQETPPAGMPDRFDRIQVPFIENKGQIPDKEVAYFAKLLNGYIHVTKSGMLTYNLTSTGKNSVVINERFTEKDASIIPLEPPPEFAMEVFRQKGQINGDIGNYYRLSYGKIHEGIELQLLAFADKLEKVYTVSPGGNPGSITVTIKGAEELKVNDTGALEILTKQGPVIFTRPNAYQFMGEERKPVEISFTVLNSTAYGFKLGGYDKARKLIIGPFLPPALMTGQYN